MKKNTVPAVSCSGEQYLQLAEELAEKGFSVMENFLEEKEVADLLLVFSSHLSQNSFHPAGIGKGGDHAVNQNIRGDLIKWVNENNPKPATEHYLQKIDLLMHVVNRHCFLALKDSEIHFSVYPPGAFYQRHLDQFRHSDHRKLSFVCYLNREWKQGDGGELRMYYNAENGEEVFKEITPKAGTFVLFRSDLIEHEVLPSLANRYSITGWMLDRKKELKFL